MPMEHRDSNNVCSSHASAACRRIINGVYWVDTLYLHYVHMSNQAVPAFWALSQSYTDGLLVENLDRQVMIVNTAFCAMFGLSADPTELRGVDCRVALARAADIFLDAPAAIERIQQIATEQVLVRNEQLETKDGRVLERDYLPMYVGGTYRGHMWLYRDITERLQRDAHAREQAALRKAVLSSAMDAIITIDANDCILECNLAAEAMFGLSASDVIGRPVGTYIATGGVLGINSPELVASLEESGEGVVGRRLEAVGRDIHGKEFPIELSVTSVDFQSQPIYTVFLRDITERTATRLHLERQQRIAHAVAESAAWLLNDDDVIATVRRTLQHMATVIGVSRSTVYWYVDSTARSLGHASLYAAWAQNDDLIPGDGHEDTRPWHDGAFRWLDLLRRGIPVYGSMRDFPDSEHVVFTALGFKSIAMMPIFIDQELWGLLEFDDVESPYTWTATEVNTLQSLAANIGAAVKRQRLTEALRASESELRDRLQDLEEKRQELERATAMMVRQEKIATLGTITSGLAHELNSPLGAILNSAERLLQDGALEHNQRRNLELIERAALRSRDVVRRLLAASRPSDSSGRQTCNVADVVRDTLDLYGGHLRMQDIALTTSIPETAFAAIGFTELSQITTNLLVNARDAVLERTDIHTKTIHVSVEIADRVYMIITDNGPGISEEIMPRLYDAFVTTKELGKGTGLGLWIVRSLLDDANGDITVTNTGEGLRVTVALQPAQDPS